MWPHKLLLKVSASETKSLGNWGVSADLSERKMSAFVSVPFEIFTIYTNLEFIFNFVPKNENYPNRMAILENNCVWYLYRVI